MVKIKNALFLVLITGTLSVCAQSFNVKKQIRLSSVQYSKLLNAFPDTAYFPHSINPDGSYRKFKSDWWCSGFFAGSLWYIYQSTKDPVIKRAAEKWTEALNREQYNKSTHDLGFMLYCSYGNGYRLTKKPSYRAVLLKGASSLASRFDQNVGLIKSWDNFKGYKYPVIIDNMMNLEYLMWAAKVSGDKKYKAICIAHAVYYGDSDHPVSGQIDPGVS